MHPCKILIVDDEWLIRSELRNMLETYEHIRVVGEAATVPDALRLVKTHRPDVVFLDIQLPGRLGFELIDGSDVPFRVVFVSAYNQYMEQAKRYRPVAYLLKPVGQNQLKRIVQKLSCQNQGGKT